MPSTGVHTEHDPFASDAVLSVCLPRLGHDLRDPLRAERLAPMKGSAHVSHPVALPGKRLFTPGV
jgi:hypothetical protein